MASTTAPDPGHPPPGMPTTARGFFMRGTIRPMPPDTTRTEQAAPIRPAFTLAVMLCFLLAVAAPKLLKASGWYRTHAGEWSVHIRWWIQPIMWLLIVATGCALLRAMRFRVSPSVAAPVLGLRTGWARAVTGTLFASVCTIPMLALGLLSPLRTDLDDLFYTTAQAGFFEELLFRAFAFGLLVQLGRVRVWPAAVLTGAIFGAIHLTAYTPAALQREFVWIAIIALGGTLYAWLYWRWRWNLWVVIALHAFMNLWWGIWDLGDNSLGPWAATAARVLTIASAITLTELAAKGERFARHFEHRTITG